MIPFNFSEIMRKRQGVNPAVPPSASEVRRPPVALPEAPARTVPLAPPTAMPPQGGAQRPSYDAGSQIRDYRNNRVTDEVDFARDQYVREGQGEGGKYKRNWKNILLNSLIGAGMGAAGGGGLGGALGGAAAAGLGSTFNPMAGREFTFNRVQAPGMYQAQERERENRQADQAEEYRAAQIEGLGARAEADRALVDAREAQEAARLRGNGVRTQVVGDDGKIYEVLRFADGTQQVIGESGGAALKREGFQNQRTIADNRNKTTLTAAEGRNATSRANTEARNKTAIQTTQMRQQGQNYRTGVSQAGQDRRLNQRLSADGGSAPAAPKAAAKPLPAGMIEKFMKQTGRSREEAVRMAREAGYDAK